MNKINNIVLSVSMDELSIKNFSELKNSHNLGLADNIHFIHIYNEKLIHNLPSSLDCSDFGNVESYVVEKLHDLAKDLIPNHINEKGDRHSLCIFNSSEKIEILNYLERVCADLVIVSSRNEHVLEGLSPNSFSYWLIEHAPCNVLVLRPKKMKLS